MQTPDARFNAVHLDLVGSIKRILSSVYTLARSHSNYITAITVAHAFISGLVSRFAIPTTITTDRRRQFESVLWTELIHLLGSSRLRTIAYHPMANGLVERFQATKVFS